MRRAPPKLMRGMVSYFLIALALIYLGGCSTTPQRTVAVHAETPAAKSGGYYRNDGPGDNPPSNIDALPDAEPKVESLHKFANNPYNILGQQYVPDSDIKPYKARGTASWYGRMFHGKKTASGEAYNMYAMTAAHRTLPIPSYARVTNLRNNKSVVVRVNDRGPFLKERVIDLSYAAAHKLGIAQAGSGLVEVESIDPRKPSQTAEPIIAVQEPVAPNPASSNSANLYLQLAAFKEMPSAESFGMRVKQKLGALADTLQIISQGGLFRINLGPYDTPGEAIKIAARIKQSMHISPVHVLR